jgi:hypothetical protein
MASTSVTFTIDSPEEGQRVFGAGFQVRGTAHMNSVGLPSRRIDGVDVQFGAGGAFIEADLSEPSWGKFSEPVSNNTVLHVVARCAPRPRGGQ